MVERSLRAQSTRRLRKVRRETAGFIERVFSSFGVILTKIRNRVGNETAYKLVFCYRMLRGQSMQAVFS